MVGYSEEIINDCKKKFVSGWSLQEISNFYEGNPAVNTLYRWRDLYKWDRTKELIKKRAEEKLVENVSDILSGIDEEQLKALVGILARIGKLLDDGELNSRDIDNISRALFYIFKAKSLITSKTSNTSWEDVFSSIEFEKIINEEEK